MHRSAPDDVSGLSAWGPPRWLPVACAILLAIALIPVFAVETVPLGDMPNHLARIHILNALPEDPDLQKYYAAAWRLFSFQSTDFVLAPLARMLGLSHALQVYVAATFVLLIAGTFALHRVLFRRTGPWPLASFLFLFNLPLAVGQVSFLFATGLSLLLFAAWVASGRRGRSWHLAAFTVAAFALLLCHFFAFAAYGLMVATFEGVKIVQAPSARERVRLAVRAVSPFLVPVLVFLVAYTGSMHGETEYGALLAKPIVLFAAFVTYARLLDIVLILAIGAGLWFLDRRKLLRFAPELRPVAIVLIAVAIAMPRQLTGVHGADIRIPCLLAFLLVAASDLRLGSRRQAMVFAMAVGILLSLRVAAVFAQWGAFDADYREFRAADAVIARGSRVAVIPFDGDHRAAPQPLTAYPFVASFAVIDRDVFLPHLYTLATPLRFTGAGAAIMTGQLARSRDVQWKPHNPAFAAADPATVEAATAVARRIASQDMVTSTIDWSDWPERFDYLVDLDFGAARNPVPALLTEVQHGSFFSIYRVHPPRAP